MPTLDPPLRRGGVTTRGGAAVGVTWGAVGVAAGGCATGELAFGWETFVGFFLAGLRCLGSCSAGSAATRDSDGATSVAIRVVSLAAAGAVRVDAGDRTIGHDTPDGQRVRLPLLDRQRSERSGASPRRITKVVRFPT